MKTVRIRKGYFYGGGTVYNWRKDGLHQFGVGIAVDVLKTEKKIKVEVAGEKFELNCEKAIEFINKYNSVKTIRGKRIGVVSKDLLEPRVIHMLYTPR